MDVGAGLEKTNASVAADAIPANSTTILCRRVIRLSSSAALITFTRLQFSRPACSTQPRHQSEPNRAPSCKCPSALVKGRYERLGLRAARADSSERLILIRPPQNPIPRCYPNETKAPASKSVKHRSLHSPPFWAPPDAPGGKSSPQLPPQLPPQRQQATSGGWQDFAVYARPDFNEREADLTRLTGSSATALRFRTGFQQSSPTKNPEFGRKQDHLAQPP